MVTPIDEDIDKAFIQELNRCERQLEHAVYETVKHLADTGRHIHAYVYMTRLAEYTIDESKKAFFRLKGGQVLEQCGEYAAAVAVYEKGLECKTDDTETRYFLNNNLGYSLIQIGKHDEAESYCREAISIDPVRHNAYKNLGLVLKEKGQHAESANCFLTASKIAPNDPRAARLLDDLLKECQEIRPRMLVEIIEVPMKDAGKFIIKGSSLLVH